MTDTRHPEAEGVDEPGGIIDDAIADLRRITGDFIASFSSTHPDLAPRLRSVLHGETPTRGIGSPGLPPAPAHGQLPPGTPEGAIESLKGRRLGRYLVGEELGRGAQGVVFAAEDDASGIAVALKVLRPGLAFEPRILGRFRREAAIMMRLRAPGICRIIEIGSEGPWTFIAMERVRGEPLSRRIRDLQTQAESCLTGPEPGRFPPAATHATLPPGSATARPARTAIPMLPPEAAGSGHIVRTLGIIEKAARALHAAHELGIIHRDVKPGNILITAGDDPVLMDFGLARDDSAFTTTLTATGDLFGTPAYMSPEQLMMSHNVALDRRTDIYSLGVTLYESLALRRPFEADSRTALYLAIQVKDAPDVRTFNPRVSPALAAVINTAVARDRDRRYRTALDFAEDLARVRDGRPTVARPPGPASRLARWVERSPGLAVSVLALFITLALGLATSIVLLARSERDREEKRLALEDRSRALEREQSARADLEDRARLADVVALRSLLAEASDDLWPALPALIPAMDAWLARAATLASRREAHEKLAVALAGAPPRRSAESGPATPAVPDDLSFRSGIAREIIAGLARLGDDGSGLVAEVAARRRLAETHARESLVTAGNAWSACLARIAANPAYRGLALAPQVGLVPLGPDPGSGLEEFAHLLTGSAPERDEDSEVLRLTPGCGVVLVLLPGATYRIGAAPHPGHADHDPFARADEAPRDVTVGPFLVSKYEFTQVQWERITGSNPSHAPAGRTFGPRACTPLCPVENVSWHEATRALAKVALALPDEAQWEYACRAGTSTPWWTGAEETSLEGAVNIADSMARRFVASWPWAEAWLDDGFVSHAPVHLFRANPFGLHGTHGNVWEWCRNEHATYADLYGTESGRESRTASAYRVIRGGSMYANAEDSRSAVRSRYIPEYRDLIIGFRPIRVLEGR